MYRTPEPELMDDHAQAVAYAYADFATSHDFFVDRFSHQFPQTAVTGTWLDLGCGPGDVLRRFARRYPNCQLHGIDGSATMLEIGKEQTLEAGLSHRISLFQRYLPTQVLPLPRYQGALSNSFLHHLADPMVLWKTIAQYTAPGCPVYVMDLCRPKDEAEAKRLVSLYSSGEPELLKRDFYDSLLAAYEKDEVEEQLKEAGLSHLKVQVVEHQHFLVSGFL